MNTENAEQALTRHLQLILDNYEDLYHLRRALVAEHLQGPDKEYPHRLADKLKEWVKDDLLAPAYDTRIRGMGESATVLLRELATVALDCIDWHEVATDYIQEAREG